MASINTYYIGLTRQAKTLSTVETTTKTLADYANDIATAESLNLNYYIISLERNPSFNSLTYTSQTLSQIETALGVTLVNGDVFIATPFQTNLTKELKQIQKLEIAAATRAADSDPRTTYDITELPTQYSGNNVVDNPNVGGLQDGRPWGPSTVTSGLTMWLDANDPASYSGSGTTWVDLSGNGSDQTLVGAPTYTSGTPSYFSFDGFTQYSTGSMPYVLPPNTYTKMVWFQLAAAGDNNLVSSDTGGHFMYFNNSSTLWAGNANVPPFSGGGAFGSATSFSYNTWYCATIVFSDPQIYLYVNGVLDNVDITYSSGGHGGDGSVNLACFGAGGNLLNGKIAEVYCYGNALTAQQVLQNFNATKAKYGL